MSDRYAKSCAGKHHYKSARRAQDAAKVTQRMTGVTMNHYPCEFHPGSYCVGATYPQQAKTARRKNAESDLTHQAQYPSAQTSA